MTKKDECGNDARQREVGTSQSVRKRAEKSDVDKVCDAVGIFGRSLADNICIRRVDNRRVMVEQEEVRCW